MLIKTTAAARRVWLAWRIRCVYECIRREHDLHRQQLAQLRAELNALQVRLAVAHGATPGSAATKQATS